MNKIGYFDIRAFLLSFLFVLTEYGFSYCKEPPISRGKDNIPIEDPPGKEREGSTELKDLRESLSDIKPAADLVKLAKTIDQAPDIHRNYG